MAIVDTLAEDYHSITLNLQYYDTGNATKQLVMLQRAPSYFSRSVYRIHKHTACLPNVFSSH
jgi:hypothetical protein